MPLHVMANFGGFLCECAWPGKYISLINLLKASLVYGHIVRGDRCLKNYGFRLSQARVDCAERFYSNCQVSKQEMQLVSKVVHSMLDASKENCIRIPTGGTPLTLARVTAPKAPVSDLSVRTRKRRVQELQKTRKILSAGPMDSDILLQDEIRALTKEEKQQLLHDAGITVDVQPIHELAMKSMLGIPWYRLRILRRWLKQSGVCLGSERKQRALCKELIGDNLEVELAPFSFKLPNGEEGLRGAAYGYTPNLTSKIVQLLEQNEKEGKLTWHGGIIPNDQIWIKLGGDKGGGLFKMIFQIVNTPKPNSVHNTCVFSCFEADDTVTNLHVALDRFRSEVDHISRMKWRTYTLKLFLTGDLEFLSIMYGLSGASGKQPCLFCLITLDQLGMSVDRRGSCVPRSLDSIILDHQSFIEAGGNLKRAKWYNNCIHDPFFNIPLSQTLKDLDSALIELEQLNQEAESVQQLATYNAIVAGAVTPIVDELLELAGNCYKRVQVQEEKVKTLRETIQMGFNLEEGPCIKGIESCLTSFGVCRQRYYGGIFVGNHVHKILKPANVDTLCSCVLKATENVPELKLEAVAVHQKFRTILMQFSECHVLYDSTVLTQDDIQHLGQAIKNFFCSFDRDFKRIARTLKMHILEDHMLEWLSMHQAGCGLMGVCDQFMFMKVNITELGVESTIEQLLHMDPPFHVNLHLSSLLDGKVQQFKAVVLELVHTGDYIKLQPPFCELKYGQLLSTIKSETGHTISWLVSPPLFWVF
eukprot:Em0002g1537a